MNRNHLFLLLLVVCSGFIYRLFNIPKQYVIDFLLVIPTLYISYKLYELSLYRKERAKADSLKDAIEKKLPEETVEVEPINEGYMIRIIGEESLAAVVKMCIENSKIEILSVKAGSGVCEVLVSVGSIVDITRSFESEIDTTKNSFGFMSIQKRNLYTFVLRKILKISPSISSSTFHQFKLIRFRSQDGYFGSVPIINCLVYNDERAFSSDGISENIYELISVDDGEITTEESLLDLLLWVKYSKEYIAYTSGSFWEKIKLLVSIVHSKLTHRRRIQSDIQVEEVHEMAVTGIKLRYTYATVIGIAQTSDGYKSFEYDLERKETIFIENLDESKVNLTTKVVELPDEDIIKIMFSDSNAYMDTDDCIKIDEEENS